MFLETNDKVTDFNFLHSEYKLIKIIFQGIFQRINAEITSYLLKFNYVQENYYNFSYLLKNHAIYMTCIEKVFFELHAEILNIPKA